MAGLPSNAQLTELCLVAEDAFDVELADGSTGNKLVPRPDVRLSPDWAVRAVITWQDAILRGGPLRLGSQRVFCGWLLQSTADPYTYVLVFRGTADMVEWLEDAEFLPMTPHPGGAGRVEAGFYGLYATLMGCVGPKGAAGGDIGVGPESPFQATVMGIMGPRAHLTVTGHSLGAAVATYAALDLARAMPGQVSARLFASPHPGDLSFVNSVAIRVPDHESVAYELDGVPRVPFGLDYAHLPNYLELSPHTAPVRIRLTLFCGHHALCYLALQDPARADAIALSIDKPYAACILPLPH